MRNSRARGSRQSGYIISIELLLIFSILIIGSIVAVVGVRDAVLRHLAIRDAAQLKVKDSTAPDPLIFGRPVNYDLCEAPQILCPDFGFDENNSGGMATPGSTEGLRALVGIRPDRFVTRNQIYFTGANCTGDAYIAPPPIPGSSNFLPSLPVGYFNCGIQVDSSTPAVPICYGVGPPTGWGAAASCDDVGDLPCSTGGRLYRSDGATTSMPAITSRWISLNPDCAELAASGGDGGGTGELVTNGSFELPAFLVNDAFSPPPPASWTVTGSGGHWDPCVSGEGVCPGALRFSTAPPDGSQIGYANAGSLSQALALTPGATCDLSVWVGCRVDSACSGGAGSRTYTVTLQDGAATNLFTPLTGVLGGGSPQWQQVSASFTVSGPAPYTLRLASSATQSNFDLASVTCSFGAGGGVATTAICDDAFDTTAFELLPAIEVTDMAGANVLSPYAPLFNVMAPVAPTFTETAPTPEATPMTPPPSNLTAPDPEES